MHGVACGDDAEGRKKQHHREQIKETSLGIHGSGLYRESGKQAESNTDQRYLASAALAAAISPS